MNTPIHNRLHARTLLERNTGVWPCVRDEGAVPARELERRSDVSETVSDARSCDALVREGSGG